MSDLRHIALLIAGALALSVFPPSALAAVDAAAVPDPTRPAAAVVAAVPEGDAAPPAAARLLQSTLVSPGQRVAVIDGQRFVEGDRLGDAEIIAIRAGVVRLRGPDGETELRLSFSPVTRPVSR